MKLKIFFLETRPQFLILSVVLAFLGTSIAWYDGFFNLGAALLAGFGLILAHASVNMFNDYFDFKSGVDLATRRTPFSGGSGILPTAMLKPGEVLWFSIISLLIAMAVGIYFIFAAGWLLLPLLLIGGFCIVLYTPVILKFHWPEWSPGLGLGILPIMGAYFVQSGAYSWEALAASVPSGILVHNLLFLNEFPDTEADKLVQRKTMPITLGPETASKIYIALTILVYVWIIAWVIAGVMPPYCLLGLLSLPFAIKAMRGSRHYGEMSQLVPALANNVMVVLLTQLLLGIGYILAKVLLNV